MRVDTSGIIRYATLQRVAKPRIIR